MTRVLLQDTMIADKETAKCIKENKWLSGDGIDLVIPLKSITPFVRKTLNEWTLEDITDKGFTYVVNKVPIRVKFIKEIPDKYKYADIKIYGAEQYKIPNPL